MVSAMCRQLYLQKRAPVPICRGGWVGPKIGLDRYREKKTLRSLGFGASAIQAVVSHSTDYAVLSSFAAKTFQHPCHSVCLFLSCFPYLVRK